MVLRRLIVALTIIAVTSPAIACTLYLRDDEHPQMRDLHDQVKFVIQSRINANSTAQVGGALPFRDIYDVKDIEKSGICSLIIGGPIPMTIVEVPGTPTSIGYRVETCGYVRESRYAWDKVSPEARPESTPPAEPSLAYDCLKRCEEGECR